MLGGQSIQAANLLHHFERESKLETGFLPINPRLSGLFGKLQKIAYVRTILTSLAYCFSLLFTIPKYDLIHIYSASYLSFVLAPTPAILIGRLFGKKLLLNYHSGEAEDHLSRWSRSALPTIKLVDEIVVPSRYLVSVFRKFGLNARPIFNLVDSHRFKFRERRPLRPVFLSNRSFEWHYGVDNVLKAFSLIQKRYPEARLIVAGDGPDRLALKRLAGDLELRNSEFIGRVGQDRIVDVYDEADVFLNCSSVDNQPLSILEAFNCGLPVITSDPGAIPDMVVHEQTGLLVPKGDYRELAANAVRLLSDPELAERLIKNARAESQKYTWDEVREEWLLCYLETLGSPDERALSKASN
jgi:glycosyltransferase involved in cell wall biosynthesis